MHDTIASTAHPVGICARVPRLERRTAHEAQLGVAELVLIASCGQAIRRDDWATIRNRAPAADAAGRTASPRR
jgi:hypothetical protein